MWSLARTNDHAKKHEKGNKVFHVGYGFKSEQSNEVGMRLTKWGTAVWKGKRRTIYNFPLIRSTPPKKDRLERRQIKKPR
jgi:hypothetical protein